MPSLGIAVNASAPFKPIKLSFGNSPRFSEAFCSQFSGTGKCITTPAMIYPEIILEKAMPCMLSI